MDHWWVKTKKCLNKRERMCPVKKKQAFTKLSHCEWDQVGPLGRSGDSFGMPAECPEAAPRPGQGTRSDTDYTGATADGPVYGNGLSRLECLWCGHSSVRPHLNEPWSKPGLCQPVAACGMGVGHLNTHCCACWKQPVSGCSGLAPSREHLMAPSEILLSIWFFSYVNKDWIFDYLVWW